GFTLPAASVSAATLLAISKRPDSRSVRPHDPDERSCWPVHRSDATDNPAHDGGRWWPSDGELRKRPPPARDRVSPRLAGAHGDQRDLGRAVQAQGEPGADAGGDVEMAVAVLVEAATASR